MFLNNENTINLVNRARLGDKQSLDQLSQLAIAPLHRHVYRIVLRDELAADIVQESLMEMCQVISKLHEPGRFWPWLCGIAFNKIRHQQRSAIRHKTVSLSEMDPQDKHTDNHDGLAAVISDELTNAVSCAISKLKPEHRAILSMRCYEQMDYGDIAKSLESNKFAVRMLFLRAKKSLAKQLANTGYSGLSIILALTIFGKITAVSEAAAANVIIGSSTISVGSSVATVGFMTSKLAIMCYMAVALIYSGSIALRGGNDSNLLPGISQQRLEIIHAQQLINNDNVPVQHWYYYPKGPGAMVMTKRIAVDPDNHISQCLLLQNHQGSFYYPYSGNKIYSQNYHYFNPDLSVMQLPTDSAEFTAYLERVQGFSNKMVQSQSRGNGLLIVTEKDGSSINDNWKLIRHHNLLGEDYFKCDWPSKATLVDNRDDIHKQGWAYFAISGHINRQQVSGKGQIPFYCDKYAEHGPWVQMQIGSDYEIVDNANQAVLKVGNDVAVKYPAGSFLAGLQRPWLGLHTIDIIRRDAIAQKMQFTTELLPDKQNVRIIITNNDNKLIYTIDLYQDLIKEIVFENSQTVGYMKFEYYRDIENQIPGNNLPTSETRKSPGIFWLMNLCEEVQE
ncbi:MAG: sigma-70 family RNA polymerase sigma factor [Phycisphaerae bacterium]|nr:sigma-70 family RNA polymerase sigma factor [Phycisphaerae bacterium]